MPYPKKGCPYTIEDCEEYPLNNKNNWSLQGFSKAGERTGFKINPLNILLDCGLPCVNVPKAILMTHGHVDHSWQLPNITGGSKTNTGDKKDPTGNMIPVFFPRQSYFGLTKLLEAASILSYPNKSFTETEVWEKHSLEPRAVSAGDSFTVNKLKIEVLQAVHVSNSLGYGFSTEKSKLKDEYKELADNQNEIIQLRKNGIEVSERVLQPEFVFYCDSTIDNLRCYSGWKKYPSIVVECTGYPEIYDKELVHKRSHTHFDDLIEIIKENKEKNWFLIHSSMKSERTLLEKYESELIKDYNVKILSKF